MRYYKLETKSHIFGFYVCISLVDQINLIDEKFTVIREIIIVF